MHPVISDLLLALPMATETPRLESYNIPVEFNVDPKSLRFSTHIRIKTPGYGPVNGYGSVMFAGEESREAFEADCQKLMALAGMEKDGPWFYPTDGCKASYVHTHPNDVSGIMTEAQINAITDGIESGQYGAKLRWIDVYEVYETVSDSEALRRIQYYEPKIRSEILDGHVTTRKTKFKSMDLLALVARLPGMRFAGAKGWGGYQPSMPKVIQTKLVEIRDSLVAEGWLITAEQNGQVYYRTANKTEQRARGLLKKAA